LVTTVTRIATEIASETAKTFVRPTIRLLGRVT
jgi:hypothetical protein